MRTVLLLASCSLLGACAFLDELEFAGPKLDPDKIYLGTALITSVPARETHKYACVKGPLLCEQRGLGFDCRCP